MLGGAGLLAAFPQAYATILSALYLPLMLMLAGLIWRGVAFEFRFKADEHHKPFWDKAFIWGSYTATFSQGLALGAFINGFEVEGGAYAGGVGYFAPDGNMDSCIVLRTAIVKDGEMHVQAGAGIVADSVADYEQRECEAKSGALLAAAREAVALARDSGFGQ